jgi:RNA binding exosome subunit
VEALPRQEVFPTPRPLSDEEQVLVAFANHVPAKVQQRVIEAQKHVGDPIVIAELKIRPLSEGEENANRQDSNKER